MNKLTDGLFIYFGVFNLKITRIADKGNYNSCTSSIASVLKFLKS